MTRAQVEGAAREMVAADCGCPQALLDSGGVAVILSRPGEGRRQQPSLALHLLCFGPGVLIAVSQQHFEWAEKNLSILSPEEIFSPRCLEIVRVRIEAEQPGWELSGPALRFLCAIEGMAPEPKVEGTEARLLKPESFGELERRRDQLPNALSRAGEGVDQALVAVYRGGELVGAAGASADAPGVWQVGVDTLLGHRRRGAAKLAVWHVTRHVLQLKITPFYSTSFSNLPSQRVARAVGYWPAWLEAYARPAPTASARPDLSSG